MAVLAAVVVWLFVLLVLAAVASYPVTIALHLLINLRRAQRRAQQEQRDDFEDAYIQTVKAIARRKAAEAAERDIAAIEERTDR